MKNILLSIIALGVVAAAPVFAADAPAVDKKALKAACKGKNPGDMVKVDGKDVACPEKKKDK